MSVRNLRRCTFEEVLLDFALAEMRTSHALVSWYEQQFGPTRLAELRRTPVSTWPPQDRAGAIQAALNSRGPYLSRLGQLDLDWYAGSLEAKEIGRVSVIDLSEFTALAPDRNVSELAGALDANKRTLDDKFSRKYRIMRPRFDLTLMAGRPMLVSEVEEGPYVEFEGLTRLCCIASMEGKGELTAPEIDVRVGVGERIREWQPFFGTPSRGS